MTATSGHCRWRSFLLITATAALVALAVSPFFSAKSGFALHILNTKTRIFGSDNSDVSRTGGSDQSQEVEDAAHLASLLPLSYFEKGYFSPPTLKKDSSSMEGLVRCSTFMLDGKFETIGASPSSNYFKVNTQPYQNEESYEDCTVRLRDDDDGASTTTSTNFTPVNRDDPLSGFQIVCGSRSSCADESKYLENGCGRIGVEMGEGLKAASSDGASLHKGFMFAPVVPNSNQYGPQPQYPLVWQHNSQHANQTRLVAFINSTTLIPPDIFKCGATSSVRTLCFNFSKYLAVDTRVCRTRYRNDAPECEAGTPNISTLLELKYPHASLLHDNTAVSKVSSLPPPAYFDIFLPRSPTSSSPVPSWQVRGVAGNGVRLLGTAFIDSLNPLGINSKVVKIGKGHKAKPRYGITIAVNDEINDKKVYVVKASTAPKPPPPPAFSSKISTANVDGAPTFSQSTASTLHLVYFHRKFYQLNIGHTLLRVLALHAEAYKLQFERRDSWRRFRKSKTFPTPNQLKPLHIALVAVLKDGGSDLGSFFLPLLAAGLSTEEGAREVLVLPDDGMRLGVPQAGTSVGEGDAGSEYDASVVTGMNDHKPCLPLVVTGGPPPSTTRTNLVSSSETQSGTVWPYPVNSEMSNRSRSALEQIHNLNGVLTRRMVSNNNLHKCDSKGSSSRECKTSNIQQYHRQRRRRVSSDASSEEGLVCLENAVIGYSPIQFSIGYFNTYVGTARIVSSSSSSSQPSTSSAPPSETTPSQQSNILLSDEGHSRQTITVSPEMDLPSPPPPIPKSEEVLCASPDPTPLFSPPPMFTKPDAKHPNKAVVTAGALPMEFMVDGIRKFRKHTALNWRLDARAARRHHYTHQTSQLDVVSTTSTPLTQNSVAPVPASKTLLLTPKQSKLQGTLHLVLPSHHPLAQGRCHAPLNASTRSSSTNPTEPIRRETGPSSSGAVGGVPSSSSTFKIVIVNRRSTRRLLNVAALQEQLLGLFLRPTTVVGVQKQFGDSNKLCVMTNLKRVGSNASSNLDEREFQQQQDLVTRLSQPDADYLPPLDRLPYLSGTAPFYYKQGSSYPPPNRNCTTPPPNTNLPQLQFQIDRADMLHRLWGRTNKLMPPSNIVVSVEVVHMEDLKSHFKERTQKPNKTTTSSSSKGSLAEQAAIFHAADVLISVHGAAVAWSTSMRDGSTLIEIIPPWWGGPIIPVESSMYGAITYANRVHHHTVSCGGRYTLAALKGSGGRAVGGYNGAIQANFNMGPLEIFQVLSLITTAVRRTVSQHHIHYRG